MKTHRPAWTGIGHFCKELPIDLPGVRRQSVALTASETQGGRTSKSLMVIECFCDHRPSADGFEVYSLAHGERLLPYLYYTRGACWNPLQSRR